MTAKCRQPTIHRAVLSVAAYLWKRSFYGHLGLVDVGETKQNLPETR